jgi:lipoprotein-releasing system ATP-binding protein
VESLSKLYHSGGTEVIVFDDLSLEVSRGEQLAIVGESGAGKSTLMHLLGGLDRPSGGRIYYGEREIVSLSEKDLANFRNREIGFVWQNPSLLPEFTAAENVMMPLLIRGVTPELAQATAGERLREVGLWNRRTHRAGELSGGERQRVGLARALITGPGVLLADEPTGNLDFRTGELILDLLGNLHAAHALTSVIVTHNPGLASRCDRVLELKKGALHTLSVMELQEAGVVVQDATRLDGGTYV